MKISNAGCIAGLLMLALSCSPPIEQISQKEIIDSVLNAVAKQNKPVGGYDEELAKRLGADQYGMASYVIAFLKKGPNRDMSPEEAMNLQIEHLDNIQFLADQGKLVVAGPIMDEGDLMGIYIFNVSTIEEARQLTATDPAIQRGSLVMELHTWYGSAGMKEVNSIHAKIMAKSVTEQ